MLVDRCELDVEMRCKPVLWLDMSKKGKERR